MRDRDLVRDSAMLEIARVRDSGSRLYIHIFFNHHTHHSSPMRYIYLQSNCEDESCLSLLVGGLHCLSQGKLDNEEATPG